MTKDLLSIFDLSAKEIWSLFQSARQQKAGRRNRTALKGKTLGLIFEKPSTRTTVSFAVAMYQLGGFPLILNASNLQRKRGETIEDTARTLSRYLDAVMLRALHDEEMRKFSSAASIPIINGLTDREHPCQVLGDILTIIEKKKVRGQGSIRGLKVAFVGDGNNVANSWLAAASLLGFTFSLARPDGYGPSSEILEKARRLAALSGARIMVTNDAKSAVQNADVIYTDVWTSMGYEDELEKRKIVFQPYQVNDALVALAKKDCLVMHCLPANRGEEISSSVLDGPHSIIFDEAENRLHIQKAVLLRLLSKR